MQKCNLFNVYIYVALLLTGDLAKLVSSYKLVELEKKDERWKEYKKLIRTKLGFKPTQILTVVEDDGGVLVVQDFIYLIVKGEESFRTLGFRNTGNATDGDGSKVKIQICRFYDVKNKLKYGSLQEAKIVLERVTSLLLTNVAKEVPASSPACAPAANLGSTTVQPTMSPTTTLLIYDSINTTNSGSSGGFDLGDDLLVAIGIIIVVIVLAIFGGLIVYGLYKLKKYVHEKVGAKEISVDKVKEGAKSK